MKKLMIVIVSIIVLLIILACGSTTSTERATSPTYEVTKSTGLYSEFDIDADMIAELSVGTLLVPADGKHSLYCDSFTDSGMTFTLCKVKIIETGETGWVLKKWIEEK